jgi:hypothetical protein
VPGKWLPTRAKEGQSHLREKLSGVLGAPVDTLVAMEATGHYRRHRCGGDRALRRAETAAGEPAARSRLRNRAKLWLACFRRDCSPRCRADRR